MYRTWITSSEVVVFFTGTLNKEFRFILTQFKTIVMERIRKPLHYILVLYTSTIWTQLHCLSAPAFGCMIGGPKMWLAHLSYSQRQVQLRHQSSVRNTYICSTIYKLEPQRLFAWVCTLHTLAALHIYTRWRLSVPLLGFAIFTVSHPLHQI